MTEYKFKKEWEYNLKNSSPVADAVTFFIFIVIFVLLAVAFGG